MTSKEALERYGQPSDNAPWMMVYKVPIDLQVGVIPKKIFCNKDIQLMLEIAFENLISRGYTESELKTWDGCFNIRKKTSGINWSLHSWGLAIDVNAKDNCYGCESTLSSGFIECFTDAGFYWGGNFGDPMHFEKK